MVTFYNVFIQEYEEYKWSSSALWKDPLLILIQLAQKNRIEQKIERLLLFQGPIQQKSAKIGLAFTISSLLTKHRLVFHALSVLYPSGKPVFERFIEKHQSELLLNLRIFYLSHAVCKILQFLMMKPDVKLDLIAIAKERLSKNIHRKNKTYLPKFSYPPCHLESGMVRYKL